MAETARECEARLRRGDPDAPRRLLRMRGDALAFDPDAGGIPPSRVGPVGTCRQMHGVHVLAHAAPTPPPRVVTDFCERLPSSHHPGARPNLEGLPVV